MGFTFALEHLVIIEQEIQMGKTSPDMELQSEIRKVMQCCQEGRSDPFPQNRNELCPHTPAAGLSSPYTPQQSQE